MTPDNPDDELKMWVAVRRDLPIPLGKLLIQAGHGFTRAFYNAIKTKPELADRYMSSMEPKIAVMVKNENQLFRCFDEAQAAGIPCSLIKDEARTVFTEKTYTVCGFGPCKRSELPTFLRRLRMVPLEVFNTQDLQDTIPQ